MVASSPGIATRAAGEWLTPPAPLPRDFFAGDARDVGRALVGKLLVRSDGRIGRLVEVEAYMGTDDPASHAFVDQPRVRRSCSALQLSCTSTFPMVSTGAPTWSAGRGKASAVLLRAAQPLGGIAAMRRARWHGQRDLRERDLCRGPGRLCEAFGITGVDNGLDLVEASAGLYLADDGAGAGGKVLATLRVGLTRGKDAPWRFIVEGSHWVSPGPRETARPGPREGAAPSRRVPAKQASAG